MPCASTHTPRTFRGRVHASQEIAHTHTALQRNRRGAVVRMEVPLPTWAIPWPYLGQHGQRMRIPKLLRAGGLRRASDKLAILARCHMVGHLSLRGGSRWLPGAAQPRPLAHQAALGCNTLQAPRQYVCQHCHTFANLANILLRHNAIREMGLRLGLSMFAIFAKPYYGS